MSNPGSARDVILGRIQKALKDVPADEKPADVLVRRTYRQRDYTPHAQIVETFIEYTVDYKALVYHVAEADLPARIAASCQQRGVSRLVVPPDLPADWHPPGVELLTDTPAEPLSHTVLEGSDGVLTGCAVAIAQTGTIVLDSGARQGRRAMTLLPDYHLCVVYSDQIAGIVPEAIHRLTHTVQQQSPLTFISGPSATSDIELNRVEGVHGPRTLEVIVVERAA